LNNQRSGSFLPIGAARSNETAQTRWTTGPFARAMLAGNGTTPGDGLQKQTAHLLSQMGGCIRRQASWGHHA